MNIIDKIMPILDILEKSPEATVFTQKLKEDIGTIIMREFETNGTSSPMLKGFVLGILATLLVMVVI
jgi:hypothetical protein